MGRCVAINHRFAINFVYAPYGIIKRLYKRESPKSEAMGKLNVTALYSLPATLSSYCFNASPKPYPFLLQRMLCSAP